MQRFKLVSKFKPTGDQPQAIEKLLAGLKKGLRDQTLLGVTGSGKTFTMANVIAKTQRPTLIISHNKTLAAQLASEFQEFFPDNAVHYFVSYYDYYQPEAYLPTTDTYIEKESDINEEIERLRHAATADLMTRSDVIIVASVSCIYGLGSPADYRAVSLPIKKGERQKRDKILKRLTELAYERNDLDFYRGKFRVKGDVLDVFPSSSSDFAYRIEFYGDEIEKIIEFDPLTGETMAALKEVIIFPATHYVSLPEELGGVIKEIKKDLKIRLAELNKMDKVLEAQRLSQRTRFDLEMMEQTGYCNGIENYSRYFDGRQAGQPAYTLIDYFPKNFLMFIDESHMTIPQINGMYHGDRSRKATLIEYGFRLPSAFDNRPLKFREFERKVKQRIFVSATPADFERKVSQQTAEQLIRPTGLLDPDIEVRPSKNQVDDLIAEIQKRVKKKQRVLVTTLTKRISEDLAEYLKEIGIKVHYLHSEIDTFERLEILRDLRLGKYDCVVGINLLREGLDLPEVSLVVILDADKEGYLRSTTALIQTMGRTARHEEGHIIMYADRETKSMRQAISEVRRRRKIQQAYNTRHGITPIGIHKEIKETRLSGAKKAEKTVSELPLKQIVGKNFDHLIHDLESKMQLAAKNLEFEQAATYRDQIAELRQLKK
ncbi:MAG: excinuclease ABC subunit UvrB [Patescibacteria group bacterium]|nr:excinuclease ABC subunit UvrB [Patescibacteria group bacterium]